MPENDAEKHLRAIRDYLSSVCDEASTVLDSSPPAEDRPLWGARLRLAQEIAQKIDAGDFLGGDQPSADTVCDCKCSAKLETLRKEIMDLRRLLGPYSTAKIAEQVYRRAVVEASRAKDIIAAARKVADRWRRSNSCDAVEMQALVTALDAPSASGDLARQG